MWERGKWDRLFRRKAEKNKIIPAGMSEQTTSPIQHKSPCDDFSALTQAMLQGRFGFWRLPHGKGTFVPFFQGKPQQPHQITQTCAKDIAEADLHLSIQAISPGKWFWIHCTLFEYIAHQSYPPDPINTPSFPPCSSFFLPYSTFPFSPPLRWTYLL